ncbi:MAG: YdgA family protein [Azonexus sp.]|jgi:uncharacterized protein YdgA (DUF945 family)|nr:YdgA family protein [Azonexus sp.]
MGKGVVVGAVAVAVLGGAYIGAAAYSGNVVQEKYEEELNKAGQMLPFLKIVDRQYEKGLFSSTATYGLQLGCAGPEGGEAKTATLTFRDHIAHGPLPGFSSVGLARIDTEIVLPPGTPEVLRQWVGSLKPEAIRSTVGFDGASMTRVELPAGEIKSEQGRLHWQAIRASFAVDGGRTTISEDFAAPEIALDLAEGEGFKLSNLRGQGSRQFAENKLFTGDDSATVTLDQMHVAVGDVQVDLNQLKLTTAQKTENDLLGSSASLTGTASVKAGERAFQFDKIELQASAKRLHAPTLEKIVLGFWQQLGNVCSQAPEDLAASLEKQQLAMLFAMKDLLTHDPEYSVDKIAVTWEGQEGSLAYSVAAKGVTSEDLQQPGLELLGKVIAKASARVPVVWLKKIAAEKNGGQDLSPEAFDAGISELIDTGYVTREGDFIVSAALFEHGELTVNGKPVDSGGLLGLGAPPSADEMEGEEEYDGD